MSRVVLGAVVLFLAGIVVGAYAARSHPAPLDLSATLVPGVRCTDSDQDLGRVWQTDALELSFHLVNDHPSETFQVDPIRGSCTCSRVVPEAVVLGPGQEAVVKAVVDLERLVVPSSGLKEFSEQVLAVATDGAGESHVVRMRARAVVQPSCTIEPAVLDFGEVVRGVPAQREVRMALPSSGGTRPPTVVGCPAGFGGEVLPMHDEPAAHRLVVRTEGELPYGPIEGSVRFSLEPQAGVTVTRSVQMYGLVVDDLRAEPRDVLLGFMRMGRQCEATVGLSSARGERFEVLSAEPEGDGIIVEAAEPQMGAAHLYRITVAPSVPGAYEGCVRVLMRTASGRRHTLSVSVRGHVVSQDTAFGLPGEAVSEAGLQIGP